MLNKRIILELGCGKGRRAAGLAKKSNTQVIGVDLLQENIQVAKQLYSGIEFKVMPAESLEFPDAYFDEIYAYDIFEHVDDLHQAIAETARVAKPSSKLVVNVPAPASEAWLLKVRPTYHQEIHHVRIFQGTELEDIMAQHGFRLFQKQPRDFSDHLILYYVFKVSKNSEDNFQLGIGNWRDTWLGRLLFLMHAFTKPELVFSSPLKYIPLWLVTLPVGFLVNAVGNRFFPKSMYFEFQKQ